MSFDALVMTTGSGSESTIEREPLALLRESARRVRATRRARRDARRSDSRARSTGSPNRRRRSSRCPSSRTTTPAGDVATRRSSRREDAAPNATRPAPPRAALVITSSDPRCRGCDIGTTTHDTISASARGPSGRIHRASDSRLSAQMTSGLERSPSETLNARSGLEAVRGDDDQAVLCRIDPSMTRPSRTP